ncbi:phage tail protein [Clostridium neonatale]|uniref:phage tail protein n=1 Tax=Clostridium neonatale TaxID=137838 RepID=UPI00291C4440|nr:putative tail fiber protein [Clostridium neonatale]
MAEEQFYTILTNVGKAKIANATLLNSNLTLKTLKVGDGNGTYYNPTEDQEDLKNTVHECAIGAIYIDKKNPNWIISETIIPGSVGGFTIREVGLFDAEGDMIAVGKYPETYKPVVANGASKDLNVRTIFEVSNAENVTLNLDPSVIIATKEDINNLQEQIDENTAQLKESAQNITNLQNNKANLTSTPQCTTRDITYYVNSNGDDSNDGLTEGTAVRTIQRAIDLIPRNIRHLVKVVVAKGRYEFAILVGFFGEGELQFVGANGLSEEHIIKYIVLRRNKMYIKFSGFKINNNEGFYTSCENDDRFLLEQCIFDSGSKVEQPGIVACGSIVEITNCTINNRNQAILSRLGSHIMSTNNQGSNNTLGLNADTGGVIAKNGTQPSGSIAENVYAGGVIR